MLSSGNKPNMKVILDQSAQTGIFQESADGILCVNTWEYDLETRTVFQGRGSSGVHGFGPVMSDVPDSIVKNGFVHPESISAFLEMYRKIFDGERYVEGVFRVSTPDGKGWRNEHIRYIVLFDKDGKPYRAIGVSCDAWDENCRFSGKDRMGLKKDAAFYGQFSDSVRDYIYSDSGMHGVHSFILIDVDEFVLNNISYSAEEYSGLIEVLFSKLTSVINDTDLFGRFESTKIAVLLKNITSRERAEQKVKEICSLLSEPVDSGGFTARLYVGCAILYNGDKSFEVIYGEADAALNIAIRGGNHGYRFFGDGGNLYFTDISRDEKGFSESDPSIPTALIADDSAINRKILSMILDSARFYVVEAKDGQETIDILNSSRDIDLVLLDISMPVLDGFEVLDIIRKSETLKDIPVIIATSDSSDDTQEKVFMLGASDIITKPYNSVAIRTRARNQIKLSRNQKLRAESFAMQALISQQEKALRQAEYDSLTGVFVREAFIRRATKMVSGSLNGSFVVCSLDIDNFKIINDQYGIDEGDRLLCHLARTLGKALASIGGICGRISADNFVAVYPYPFMDSEIIKVALSEGSTMHDPDITVSLSCGFYIVTDTLLPVESMIDRAMLAKDGVKGRYDKHSAVYDESMMRDILQKQEIVSMMTDALVRGQFEVWFQAQHDHSNGERIGAEALVRWRHPEYGIISPALFIPIFEQNGFVYSLDKYVWELVCQLQKKWSDEGKRVLPVSVNVSRHDIFQPDFFDFITGLVEKYNVPKDVFCLEITESAFSKSADQIISMVDRLYRAGFCVEIDDFGCGYSSLNILKDVSANILKLDMRFLENSEKSHRGGKILESVIIMAKWLDMEVIAEGVETVEQADYLKSLGCNMMQGYYYSRPISVSEYEKTL